MSWPRQRVFPAAFDIGAIEELQRHVSALPMSLHDHGRAHPHLRYGEARWLDRSKETASIHELVERIFLEANNAFRFDVDGIQEPLLHVTYPEGGHFSWHTDTSAGTLARRKLSISVLLTPPEDFDGGELEFCPGGRLDNSLSKGSAVVFPSYMAHRVTQVSRGIRIALVGWMHGPEFR